MNILFSLDDNYVAPLLVLITSLVDQHPKRSLHFYILHQNISKTSQDRIQALVEYFDQGLNFVTNPSYYRKIERAYTNRYYSVEMYFWLFAPFILDESVDRILYLDPDIINLNPIDHFYETDLDGKSFAACAYNYKNAWVQPINNLRLGTLQSLRYFNTGVVLMDLNKIRQRYQAQDILDAIQEKEAVLYLPDQDVYHYLFESDSLEMEWKYYNMDPRPYELMQWMNPKIYNSDFVEEEVVFIHYSSPKKPWKDRDKYSYSLGDYWYDYEKKYLDCAKILKHS